MSWYDEFLDWASAGDVDTSLTDAGSDLSYEDIVSGTDDLFTSYQSNNGSPMYGPDTPEVSGKSSYDGYTTGEGYTKGYDDSGIEDMPKSLSAKNETLEEKGLFDKTSDFVTNNKKLTDIGLGLISSAYGSNQKKKEDNKAYERMLENRAYQEKIQKEKEDRADARRGGGGGSSAMEMLAAKDAIDQANKAKFSASITGLRPQGIINKGKKLTYVGGKPVYTDSGQLA